MPKGKDTSRHPNRRVDNVVFGNFGHPMQNHPAFMASRGMLPKLDDWESNTRDQNSQRQIVARKAEEEKKNVHTTTSDDAPVHGIPRPSTNDDAPVKGIPRPKPTKKEMDY